MFLFTFSDWVLDQKLCLSYTCRDISICLLPNIGVCFVHFLSWCILKHLFLVFYLSTCLSFHTFPLFHFFLSTTVLWKVLIQWRRVICLLTLSRIEQEKINSGTQNTKLLKLLLALRHCNLKPRKQNILPQMRSKSSPLFLRTSPFNLLVRNSPISTASCLNSSLLYFFHPSAVYLFKCCPLK